MNVHNTLETPETGPPVNIFPVHFTPEEIALLENNLDYGFLFKDFFTTGIISNETRWSLLAQLRTIEKQAATDGNARHLLALLARHGITAQTLAR